MNVSGFYLILFVLCLFLIPIFLFIIISCIVNKRYNKKLKVRLEKEINSHNYLDNNKISDIDSTLNNKLINDIAVNLYSTYRNAYVSLNYELIKKIINIEFFKKYYERIDYFNIMDPYTSKLDIKFEYLGITDIIISDGDEKVVVYFKITEPVDYVSTDKSGIRSIKLFDYSSTSVVKIVLFRKLNSSTFIIDSFEEV